MHPEVHSVHGGVEKGARERRGREYTTAAKDHAR